MNSRLAVRLARVKKRHRCKFVPRRLSMIVVSKLSDHLHQLPIADNMKVNYKILNYYKNVNTKFDEEKFILSKMGKHLQY